MVNDRKALSELMLSASVNEVTNSNTCEAPFSVHGKKGVQLFIGKENEFVMTFLSAQKTMNRLPPVIQRAWCGDRCDTDTGNKSSLG